MWADYPNPGPAGRFVEDLTLIRGILGSICYEWRWNSRRSTYQIRRID